MTASPSDEPHQSTSKAMSKRKVEVKIGANGKEPAYTAADAAEFSRRGASMVAWVDEEGK